MLESGGNAFDAAVATSFALSVVRPSLNGLGGDFMAMLYKDGKVQFINGSGWAPRKLKAKIEEMGLSAMPRHGPLSPVVPGMIYGVYEM